MSETADRTDAERELLAATERAIAEYGVSAVTTQKIADQWGRSQSLVHYYYDTKDALVVAYIEWVRDGFQQRYAEHADDPPLQRLHWAVVGDLERDDCADPSTAALYELHAQAPHDEAYRAALNELEDCAREFVETAIADGVAAGTFRDVDPADAATFLLSAHDGGVVRTVSLDRTADAEGLRAGVEQYVRHVLLTDDVRGDWTGFTESGD